MKKTAFYKIGKILCCTTIGVAVLALVIKKKLNQVKREMNHCQSD
ncbi:hypothetical protein [Flavobacterium sp. JP2137]